MGWMMRMKSRRNQGCALTVAMTAAAVGTAEAAVAAAKGTASQLHQRA